jgi:Protein of unknown function (DUF429)
VALLPALGTGPDRSGAGLVVETYPAGSLRRWNLAARGYKSGTGRDLLAGNARDLRSALRLDFADPTSGSMFESSDHAFDAVVAAATARAAMLPGGVDEIPPDLHDLARVEGWIALPAADSLERMSR